MFIAKVIGNVWATQKTVSLNGKRLLLVDKMAGIPPQTTGNHLMAIADSIDAGIGDTVLVMDEGGSARSILGESSAPVRTIIVAIIDQVQISDTVFYFPDNE